MYHRRIRRWKERSLKGRTLSQSTNCFPQALLPTPPGSSMLSGILFHCFQFCLFETPLGFSYLTINLLLIIFCSAPKGQGRGAGGGAGNLGAGSTASSRAPAPTARAAEKKLEARGQRRWGGGGRGEAGKRGKGHLSSFPHSLLSPSITRASSTSCPVNYGLDKLLWASVGIQIPRVTFLLLVKIN